MNDNLTEATGTAGRLLEGLAAPREKAVLTNVQMNGQKGPILAEWQHA